MTGQDRRPAAEPRAICLEMPAGYEVARDDATLLPWSKVEDQLVGAANYWLATTRPDGRPHVTSIWDVWVDHALYFTGIPTARWARNMAMNPAITVHLESGNDVVIAKGEVEDIESITDADLAARIVQAWDNKYGRLHPDPAADGMFRLRPRSVRAWSRFPDDATRWTFDRG